jgi:ribonuclease HI
MISIYTDGACSGNPGPGGYGVVIKKDGKLIQELSGGYAHTTNNRMELMSVIVGLEYIKDLDDAVTVTSDSKYVTDAFNAHWITGWKKKNFKNVKNVDLWNRLIAISEKLNPKYVWIKGHAGHVENERCDVLGVEAYKSDKLQEDVGYGIA